LDEADTASGAVQYVHGSHLRGLRFHDYDCGAGGGFAKSLYDFTDEDDDLLREVGHLHPGDVVVHHGLTIHYAPPNLTSRRRRGLVVNYVAEHIAYTLADDLYMPALTFRVGEAGSFRAAVPDDAWPERRAFIVTSLKCALACVCERIGSIPSTVEIDADADEVVVTVLTHSLRRHAVLVLVKSGHVVRGVDDVRKMPLQLGSFEVPALSNTECNVNSEVPDKYLGAWMLCSQEASPGERADATDLAMWFQTLSGVYVDIRIPKSIIKLRSLDFEGSQEPTIVAMQRSSAGVLSCHGKQQEIALRTHVTDFHPYDGMPDVRQMSRSKDGDAKVLVGAPMSPYDHKETWMRVDDAMGPENIAALELIDEEHGCVGFWVVVGSWFGRVIGRRSGDIFGDVVCRSFLHALNTYADKWEIDLDEATSEYEATVGRVEAPGVFRIVSDFDATREGSLLLDMSKQQLRRDSSLDNVLVESWSNYRWRVRELPSKCTAFGNLKRIMS
jgi:hypothetical protein